ncbi:DEAD-domain-containing protein [Hortaea werneckii]|nr:DEAD-domain-containing protein [Hortaea werneckii]KAI6990984.1 DEAD-domain-containing protein [Hortaea werneckii]KAI7143191.1 DEAD-domain-containing protein [Hortaea werneckii]KAI7170722.1 DEAD-domain-containing protein [Hortaea werneckii]KAI7186826.1 DEAD-domain-containing protein [Hortaea werneckii]
MAPMMLEDDFIPTLSDSDAVSDEETSTPAPAATAQQPSTKRKREDKKGGSVKKRKKGQNVQEDDEDDSDNGGEKDEDMLSDFEFDNSERTAALGSFDGWNVGNAAGDADAINRIVARRQGAKAPAPDIGGEDEESAADEDSGDDDEVAEDEEEDPEDASDAGSDASDEDVSAAQIRPDDDDHDGSEDEADDAAVPVSHPDDDAASDSGSDDQEDAIELEKQRAFFAPESEATKANTNGPTDKTFTSMSLSRPILKGLSEVGFNTPTPIQLKTVPVALEGKDIVGGAVTGSGKTAAFLIPILERLLYRPKRVATTRVAILMPTRELALQCLTVGKKLAAFTDITFGRAIGGMNSREQERELKLRPDVVVATPGRFIDFMRNSPSFQTDKLEILVLDEADRMLEEGFADELNEILKTIPKSRQTMLFSATMSSKVDDLVRVGLQRPVRVLVDAQKSSASGLVQEFVRLRPGREEKRLGYLLHLAMQVHQDRVIIFFRQKKEAHRVRIIFALLGLQAAELHGSMTQEQRINSIEAFRNGRASFLLATDLASRGLDIKGIEVVINYEAPQSHEIYLHRVGRTARAGRKGISCTLAAEPDRKVVKAAVKAAKAQKGATIRQRTVDPKDADAWQAKCDGLEEEVEAVMKEEKEEKALSATEREITRAENVVKYEDEIKARPKKTWFESEQQKSEAKQRGAEALNGPAGGEGEKKRKKGGEGKLSNKQKKRLQDKDERKSGREWKKGKGDKPQIGSKGKPSGGKPKGKGKA